MKLFNQIAIKINELQLCFSYLQLYNKLPRYFVAENNRNIFKLELLLFIIFCVDLFICQFLPGLTHGLVKLEGWLDRKVRDDLTHLPGVHGRGDLLVHLGSLLVG